MTSSYEVSIQPNHESGVWTIISYLYNIQILKYNMNRDIELNKRETFFLSEYLSAVFIVKIIYVVRII